MALKSRQELSSERSDPIRRQEGDDWALHELQARFCKALAHPTRLAIIHNLKEGPCSVTKLADRLGVRQANLSQHLAMLRAVGAVTTKRSGTSIIYSIADEKIVTACSLMHKTIEERVSQQKNLFK